MDGIFTSLALTSGSVVISGVNLNYKPLENNNSTIIYSLPSLADIGIFTYAFWDGGSTVNISYRTTLISRNSTNGSFRLWYVYDYGDNGAGYHNLDIVFSGTQMKYTPRRYSSQSNATISVNALFMKLGD